MKSTHVLLIATLFLALAGPAPADDTGGMLTGSGTASLIGNTSAASANSAAAVATQSSQQGQSQSQTGVFNSYSSTPSVNISNGAPIVVAPGAGAKDYISNNANSPSVNVSNNSPSLLLANDSPSLVVNFPDQPTIYPGFAANPPAELPFMRHHDINRAWNTSPSLFDMTVDWDYSQIGRFDKHVALDGKTFATGEGSHNTIRVYVTKDEAMKAALPTTLSDGRIEKKLRYLFAGAAHGDVEGVSILDCEMAALAKAKELGANGIVVKIEGFTVASKTKGKSIGVGATGTWLERFGNMAAGIPINFAYASALGDGFAKPFICFYVVEVKER